MVRSRAQIIAIPKGHIAIITPKRLEYVEEKIDFCNYSNNSSPLMNKTEYLQPPSL